MNFRLFEISATRPQTDWLLLGLLLVSLAVLALVFGLMLLYVVRYRYNSPVDRGDDRGAKLPLRDQLDGRHSGGVLRSVYLGLRHLRAAISSRHQTP